MASGTVRNGGGGKLAAKTEKPPSSQFATPKPSARSRVSSATSANGIRRSGSISGGTGGARNDPGGTFACFTLSLFCAFFSSVPERR